GGEHDQPGDVARCFGDARCEHSALAVAQYEHPVAVDAVDLAEGGYRGDRVVGGFVVDVVVTAGEILRTCLGALVIAQHRDAACGQCAGNVQEGPVGTDRLVAVL